MWLHSAQTVDELLADPLIQMVMRADRVDAPALKGLFSGVATQIADSRRGLDLSGARVRFGGELAPAPERLLLAPPSPLSDRKGRLCC